jgi:hypothetical protein
MAPGAVDAHQHVGAALADLARGRGHQGARARLLGFGHAVLEIQDDGVGAARVSAGDELVARDRHEQHRAP